MVDGIMFFAYARFVAKRGSFGDFEGLQRDGNVSHNASTIFDTCLLFAFFFLFSIFNDSVLLPNKASMSFKTHSRTSFPGCRTSRIANYSRVSYARTSIFKVSTV